MVLFVDKMDMDNKPRKTSDGYLVATPRVGRTGIQIYGGDEVGRPDMDTVRVYRPEDEVFHVDTLHSMAHRPVTNDHPPVLVDASNWTEYSRGITGDQVARDGEFIRVPMAVMDADTIRDIEGGKYELSLGYTADLDWTPGVVPGTGEQYDAVQRNIRGNHLAIVDAARGGDKLRVIDTNRKEETSMNLKKMTVDGITIEVTDTAAEVVAKKFKDTDEDIAKKDERIKELEDELAELKEESAAKDAQVETLKEQVADAALTPAKLDAAVKARTAVIDSARKMLPKVVVDGKTDAEIRRQVVDARMGEKSKDWTDAQIEISYNTLIDTAAPVKPVDNYADAHRQSGAPNAGELSGRAKYLDRLSKAHMSVAK